MPPAMSSWRCSSGRCPPSNPPSTCSAPWRSGNGPTTCRCGFAQASTAAVPRSPMPATWGAVHTVARVCNCGHGGQIVVSSKTKASVEGRVPPVSPRQLGRTSPGRRPQPEALFQIQAKGCSPVPGAPACRRLSPRPSVNTNAASIKARCVNACGKLPSNRPARGSYSSASRPTSVRRSSSRSNSSRASSTLPW